MNPKFSIVWRVLLDFYIWVRFNAAIGLYMGSLGLLVWSFALKVVLVGKHKSWYSFVSYKLAGYLDLDWGQIKCSMPPLRLECAEINAWCSKHSDRWREYWLNPAGSTMALWPTHLGFSHFVLPGRAPHWQPECSHNLPKIQMVMNYQ